MTEIEKKEFVKQINILRLANKNKWFHTSYGTSIGTITIKCYSTWLQILKFNNVNYGGRMDISVKDFKMELTTFIEKISKGEN